jgi:hypothetical protein
MRTGDRRAVVFVASSLTARRNALVNVIGVAASPVTQVATRAMIFIEAGSPAPARPDRTSKPGITFIIAITTGHRQETHGCGTLRILLRRMPHPWANQG